MKIENFTFQIGRGALPGNSPIFNFHFSIFNSFSWFASVQDPPAFDAAESASAEP